MKERERERDKEDRTAEPILLKGATEKRNSLEKKMWREKPSTLVPVAVR